jgi:hypothetical protein
MKPTYPEDRSKVVCRQLVLRRLLSPFLEVHVGDVFPDAISLNGHLTCRFGPLVARQV